MKNNTTILLIGLLLTVSTSIIDRFVMKLPDIVVIALMIPAIILLTIYIYRTAKQINSRGK